MKIEKKTTILIVDDSRSYRAFLQDTLELSGYGVLQAAGSREMWNILESSDSVDLIVLDWELPEENGIAILEQLRANSRYWKLPVIMNTAYHSLEIVRQALYSGCDDYVSKEEGTEYIRDRITRLLKIKQAPGQYAQTRIMLVDDSPSFSYITKNLLEETVGIEVFTFDNAADALKFLDNHTVDLALVDWIMPKMDGVELVQKIRKKHVNSPLLIAILSTKSTEKERIKALEAGADDLIAKKQSRNFLLKRVQSLLRIQNRHRRIENTLVRIGDRIEDVVKEKIKDLENEKNYSENITRSISDTLLVLHPDNSIHAANPAACELLGYSENELLGMQVGRFLEEQKQEQEQEQALTIDNCLLCKDGSRIPVTVSRSELLSGGEAGQGEVWVIYDLRERIAMEKERMEQTEKLAYQGGLAEMRANTLHNIGNAMTGISSSTEGLREQCCSLADAANLLEGKAESLEIQELQQALKMGAEFLHEIYEKELQVSSEEILLKARHINDIICIQQAEAEGQVRWNNVFDLSEAIQEAITLREDSNQKYQIALRTELDAQIGEITLPRNPLMQMLVNLLKNAEEAVLERKESEAVAGEICITTQIVAEKKRALQRTLHWRLTISDNGCGIATQNLTGIFHHGFSTKKQGSGYGLHSAATFVQSIGGTIEAQSGGKNRGASFVVNLPVVAPS